MNCLVPNDREDLARWLLAQRIQQLAVTAVRRPTCANITNRNQPFPKAGRQPMIAPFSAIVQGTRDFLLSPCWLYCLLAG